MRADGTEGEAELAGGSGLEVSVELLQKYCEDQILSEATDLTLRSLQITSIGSAFAETPCLEVLSLSHNWLSNIEGIQNLKRLQYLNLNFNNIVTLEGIGACKELRKLFLSNNQVTDLEPLASCQRLECLSMFANRVANLNDVAFTLGSLPNLADVDLSGNPVASSPAYRHRLVTGLPSLATLDGDSMGVSDREHAYCFFSDNPEYSHQGAPSLPSILAGAIAPAENAIPVTQYTNRPETPCGFQPHPESIAYRPASAGGPSKDSQQLFRDDFLNKHPILLEYIVDSAVAARPSSARPGTAAPRPPSGNGHVTSASQQQGLQQLPSAAAPQLQSRSGSGNGRRRSFVHRLRSMAAEMNTAESLSVDEIVASGRDSASANFEQSALEEELLGSQSSSSPHEIIRRLLQICCQLEEERDAAEEALKSAHGRQSAVLSWGETEVVVRQLEKLHEDNRRLLTENKNMYLLLEENRRLKEQLSGSNTTN